jgi:hypothetical protein
MGGDIRRQGWCNLWTVRVLGLLFGLSLLGALPQLSVAAPNSTERFSHAAKQSPANQGSLALSSHVGADHSSPDLLHAQDAFAGLSRPIRRRGSLDDARIWPGSTNLPVTEVETLLTAESATAGASVADTSWTTGLKKVLVIRVNFPDDLTEPGSQEEAEDMMAQVREFYGANSYGRLLLEWSVTPLLTLPRTVTEYASDAGRCFALRADALAAAGAAGYAAGDYDLDIVLNGRLFGFRANVKAKGCWLQAPSTDAAVHELGHNLGAGHANLWIGRGDTIIGPGRMLPYGNMFDAMADVLPGAWAARHFNACHKQLLGWLPETQVRSVTNSGIYRLYPLDASALDPDAAYALCLSKDAERTYWIESRQECTTNPWAQNGVLLYFGPWSQSYGTSPLLDTTPNSHWADDSRDAPLLLGRTFSDPGAGIHVTPLSRSQTVPPWTDVQVVLGYFPENLPPVVRLESGPSETIPGMSVVWDASSADPDGDTVLLSWDFGDGTFAGLTNRVEKHWDTPGEYLVRCWASDLKGGVSCTSRIIRVGQPLTWRVSGRVTCQGQPLPGVRISLTDCLVTYTDADGFYTAVGVINGYYQLHPGKGYYAFAPASRFVIITNATVVGQDFEATSTAAPNNPPYVTTWNPGPESIYGAPANVLLRAWAYDDGEVQMVQFTAGAELAVLGQGTSYLEVWTNLWTDVPPGEHLIAVQATDDFGATGEAWPTRILVLEDPPVLASIARLTGSQFALDISGTAGQRLVVEASTNLVNWTTVSACTNLTGQTRWVDLEADGFRQRFYRMQVGEVENR